MIGFVIHYPGCIMDEVEPTIDLLRDKIDLKVVKLEEVSSQWDGQVLIFPGGSCDEAIVHEELHGLIQKVDNQQGVLAGICNGALVLASAGVLKGRKCTHTAVPKYAPLPEFKELLEVAERLFAGSIYIDEDVVISGHVITAKPHVPEEFALAVLDRLK